jgi:excisionase family DNA binding protein
MSLARIGQPTPPGTPAATPWLTAPEAAEWAKVAIDSIYRACRSGGLRHARVGGRRDIRLKAEWVDAWLERTVVPCESRSREHDALARHTTQRPHGDAA